MKEKYLRNATIAVAIIVLGFSVYYFISGYMVPGVLPFGLAAILGLMIATNKGTPDKKWLKYVVVFAIVLNLVVGVTQIIGVVV